MASRYETIFVITVTFTLWGFCHYKRKLETCRYSIPLLSGSQGGQAEKLFFDKTEIAISITTL